MAKSKNNVLTFGLSGKVGGMLIFRQKNGETIVAKIPDRTKPASEKQLARQRRFKQAVIYGQSALLITESKSIYEEIAKKTGKTPFIAAVGDFLNVPEINSLDLSDYSGQPGNTITIEVDDDVLVKEVRVSIIDADGSVIEEGPAVPDALGYVWTYTAVQNNDDVNGDKIVISVSDLPGNVVEKTETV
jgi:hypothetical protein